MCNNIYVIAFVCLCVHLNFKFFLCMNCSGNDEHPHGSDEREQSATNEGTNNSNNSVNADGSLTTPHPEMPLSTGNGEDYSINRPHPIFNVDDRRWIYLQNYHAAERCPGHPPITPKYFTLNTDNFRRIIPWVYREVHAILCNYDSLFHDAFLYLFLVILHFPLRSKDFRRKLRPIFGKIARHFQHELACYCESELSMEEYDRVVTYRRVPFDRSRYRNGSGLDAIDIRIPYLQRRSHNPYEVEVISVDSDSDARMEA